MIRLGLLNNVASPLTIALSRRSVSTMTVRAAVIHDMGLPTPYAKSKPIKIEQIQLAEPSETELKVRIRSAGLCHSDLSVINKSRQRPMPMALGHESAGEVVQVGAAVKNFAVGDHVVMTFTPTCGHCIPCASGHPALCEPGGAANAAGTLIDGAIRLSTVDGQKVYHHLGVSGFAEYAVVSPDSLVKIDPTLAWEHAALFGCAVMTGVGAAINTAGVQMGTTVAVVGLGGVGLSAIMGARAAGARKVFAVDMKPEKLKLALEVGATDTVLASDPDAVKRVRDLTSGGVDYAFEMAGSIRALDSAVQMTRRGGITTTAGLPPGDATLPVNISKLVGEERRLQGSYMGSCVPARDIPRYIAMFKDGKLPVDKLLTEIIDLEDINDGFDKLQNAEAIRQVVLF